MSSTSILPPCLVQIPAGDFWMGSDDGLLNERPLHLVRVPAFELAVHPVTREEYGAFLEDFGEGPGSLAAASSDDPGLPACGVSWFDAVAYCDWLGGRLGGRFHLPTEAQREWAARGGRSGQAYPWGDAPRAVPPDTAVGPERVGSGAANGFGLFGVGDNVHEWCADWYDAGYYAVSPADDPRGPALGSRRSARGGSWRHQIPYSRNAARAGLDPSKRFADFGFRVARSPAFDYVP